MTYVARKSTLRTSHKQAIKKQQQAQKIPKKHQQAQQTRRAKTTQHTNEVVSEQS